MKLPPMHKVESSNLDAVGYEAASSMMFVRFKRETGGKTYQYKNVPHHVYQELLEDDSPGKYFAAHIRNRPEYPAEEVLQPEEQEPPTL